MVCAEAVSGLSSLDPQGVPPASSQAPCTLLPCLPLLLLPFHTVLLWPSNPSPRSPLSSGAPG